jgi:predicted HTH transcriptional regulator
MHREAHLIEQWGTGVRRIFDEAKALGLPEPKIEEIGMRLRFTVYLLQPHSVALTGSGKKTGAQSGAQSKAILAALSEGAFSASELMEVLGLESKTGAFKRAIRELMEQKWIEYTLPEKPSSRLQKYRLTGKQGEEL